MKKRVFVALSTFGECGSQPLELLKKHHFSADFNPYKRRLKPEEVITLAKNYEGIIAGVENYSDATLHSLDKLQCISRCGVGMDNIDLDAAKALKIGIRNTPDVVIQPVAEFTLALIFDLLRKVTLHTSSLKKTHWKKYTGSLLGSQKIGIMGLGRIGRKVSELLKKIGANIYGTDIYPDLDWAKKIGIQIVSQEQLIKDCDVISIHLASLKDHPFQFGKKEISNMKKGASLINVARGNFIDENALYEALVSGQLQGAALDVFQDEPYSGKLCSLDNIILTPHIASLTRESRLEMEIQATQNLINFFE